VLRVGVEAVEPHDGDELDLVDRAPEGLDLPKARDVSGKDAGEDFVLVKPVVGVGLSCAVHHARCGRSWFAPGPVT